MVKTIELNYDKTVEGLNLTDITRQVEHCIIDSKLREGIAIVHVTSPELSISTMEFEPGSISDMKKALEKLVPNGDSYHYGIKRIQGFGLGGMGTAVSYREHNNGEGKAAAANGKEEKKSDIRHALLGPSITIPVKDNRMLVGIWQKIVLIDFSKGNGGRKKVILQIVGE